MAFRRRDGGETPNEGHEALRQQWLALDELKRQLAERVQAVQERERELQRAIAAAGRADGRQSAPAVPPVGAPAALEQQRLALAERERALATREAELTRREAELATRQVELTRREAELEAREAERGEEPAPAEIEARLAELRAAEGLFLRTRDELAARSEAVAARERLVAQRERELDEHDETPGLPPLAIGELEARLRRLEQRQQAGEETQSFSAGFRKLQQNRSRRAPRA